MNEKYHKLEQKMEKVLESQEKLRSMEQKILHLGQDNNIVKNLAELVKNQK
jgi:HSP90 family molecular chaperone